VKPERRLDAPEDRNIGVQVIDKIIKPLADFGFYSLAEIDSVEGQDFELWDLA
jgi:hypothetical protein